MMSGRGRHTQIFDVVWSLHKDSNIHIYYGIYNGIFICIVSMLSMILIISLLFAFAIKMIDIRLLLQLVKNKKV